MHRVPIIRLRYFIWIVVPAAIYAVVTLVGTPYLIWSYTWRGAMTGDRYYTSCTYVGEAGVLIRSDEGGKCPWVIFVKAAKA